MLKKIKIMPKDYVEIISTGEIKQVLAVSLVTEVCYLVGSKKPIDLFKVKKIILKNKLSELNKQLEMVQLKEMIDYCLDNNNRELFMKTSDRILEIRK